MSEFASFPQIIGYIASFVIIFAYNLEDDRNMKIFDGIGCLIFAFHFLLLGQFAIGMRAERRHVSSSC